MRRLRSWVVRSSLSWLGLACFGAPALAQTSLRDAIAAAEALGARTGVVATDASGAIRFRHRPNELFAPASNQKLLTAAALLGGLGAEFRFTTRFALRAGRLLVTASGDPNWLTGSAHAPEVVFAELAAALQKLGVRALAGIDLEPGVFRGPARPATWPADQLQTYYCAPTGPFVLDLGTFSLRVASTRGAVADAAVVAPLCDLPLRGAIEMVEAQKGAVYGALEQNGAVVVRGKLFRRAAPAVVKTAVGDPATFYLAALRRALAEAGIRCDAAGTAVPDGEVFVYQSELAPALLRMLEDSSNFDAEQCLRVLGAVGGDGSLAGGMASMHQQLRRLVGELPPGVVLLDGSGLSKDNRLSPELLVAAMQAAAQLPGGRMLHDALPIAGRSGTLEERFRGTNLVGRVHAKTGWIRGASALSGALDRADGSRRWFAILMNYDPKQNGLNKDLKQLQEAIVAALDRGEGVS